MTLVAIQRILLFGPESLNYNVQTILTITALFAACHVRLAFI